MNLNFPPINMPTKEEGGKVYIYDIARKKYVLLTPEEWVRQHLIHFLINERQYPLGLIAVERGLTHNNIKRRTDVVVYTRALSPWLIAECKAPDVRITQQTFNQVARYNMALQVPLLLVTNGIYHFCCQIDYQLHTYKYLPDIPAYQN